MRIPKTYTLISKSELEELRSQAFLLKHQKSGARLFLLSNDDKNKVFTIGFRTPVADSTGVPHILEHSVLCGSERYPVKDPFMEMAKSSLQTFLNAMTFPDKTLYPVASCNDKDFQNLMSVYMDAVLRPLIYQEKKIFEQEGWHYELESEEAPLAINGVVYNEMKGAYSSPEEVLERYSQASLFPELTYSHESGGDPEVIPSLSYEAFLDFHRRYYHPSNSYIYLYGDMDMEEKLIWLDREYLSHYDEAPVDSAIPLQKPFDEPVVQEIAYPIPAGEDGKSQTYYSCQWVVGENTDPILHQALQVLEHVLLGAQGAPLKQALLDAGLGQDVFGGYQNSIRQPYFSVMVKDAEGGEAERFRQVIRETLSRVVEEGLGERALRAALNKLEFRTREEDFGSLPKGLAYGIECFDSWLYGSDPRLHLQYEKAFAFLRDNLDNGYFESLIQRYLLDNPHNSLVILNPKPGLAEEREQKLAEKLAAYRASLSPEELAALAKETAALAAYQEEETPREVLDCLPSLTREDIDRKTRFFVTKEKTVSGLSVAHHETDTNGILYLRLLYDISDAAAEELSTLGLLRSLMCLTDTEVRSYQELSQEIDLATGGMSNQISVFEAEDGSLSSYFELGVRVMPEQLARALELMDEILHRSDYHREKRLRELIGQFKSRAEMLLLSSGHSTAALRALSYHSATSYYQEQIGGVSYFRYLQQLCSQDAASYEALADQLAELGRRYFTPERLRVSVTCDAENYRILERELPHFAVGASTGCAWGKVSQDFPLIQKNEGFATAGQVQYVARSGNFSRAGLPYTGALLVLRMVLANDYLWNQVRVRGGAYGCMCSFSRNGNTAFVSYRDPNLKRTLKVYEDMVPYLRELSMEEKTLTGFIISVIGSADRPMTPADWGQAAFQLYMEGVSDEERQRQRDAILDCTVETLRGLAAYVEAVLADGGLCVVGSAAAIEKEKELFFHVENLS